MPAVQPLTDAIIVVPGMFGSELTDPDGNVAWGGRLTMSRAFLSRTYGRLLLTDDDLAGHPDLRPTGLITRTTVLPHIGAQVPYTELLRSVTEAAIDPRAVVAFAYDWRLSVEHNAKLLRETALAHLEQWTATLTSLTLGEDFSLNTVDPDDTKVSFLGHSTGALIASAAVRDAELSLHTRQVVALGAPVEGAARVIDILNQSASEQFPDEVGAQQLAAASPAFYDLLPHGPCVDDAGMWRELTPADLATLGADEHLAQAAFERRSSATVGEVPPPIVHMTGFTIPTPWSIESTQHGWMSSRIGVDGRVVYGDGLVAHQTRIQGSHTLPQLATHEDLAAAAPHVHVAVNALHGGGAVPRSQPPRRVGIVAPTTSSPGLVRVQVCERDMQLSRRDKIQVTSRHEYQAGKWYQPEAWASDIPRDGCLTFSATLRPGAYRVTAHVDGRVAVSTTVAVLSRN